MGLGQDMLTAEDLQSYRGTGFVVVRDAVPRAEIKNVYQMLARLCAKHFAGLQKELGVSGLPVREALHRVLKQARVSDLAAFGVFYDSAQTSAAVRRLLLSEKILNAAAQILGEPTEALGISSELIRMDGPEDTRNTLGWHQESSYSFLNLRGEHGLVCWCPLQDVAAENGTIVVCPGSHKEGKLEAQTLTDDPGRSETRSIPEEALARYAEMDVAAKAGDAVIFHMDTFHRSGFNHSEEFRFSVRARFHKTLAEDFVPHRPLLSPNKTRFEAVFGRSS